MISAGEFRNGVTFDIDGTVFQIIEFQHVKPGKGAAFVRTKIRNVISGAVLERTFNPTEKFPTAFIERKDMQYLYNDEALYYFMDNESFETVPINADKLGDNFKFVKENTDCKILSYKGVVFGVEPPNFVELEVTDTDPGFAGNTATNATKPATLETGAEIRVPLFINPGDKIRAAIRKATLAVEMVPVTCGSSYRNKGVQKLLDAIVDFMPSPLDIPAIKGVNPDTDEEDERPADDNAPFSALAFKIMTDPYVGRLSFFRVYSGKLTTGSSVLNSTKNQKERIGRILQMHANHREDIEEVFSGDIAAAVGLKNTTTGDTLCDDNHPIILESMEFPDPVIRVAIEPKTKAGQEKMGLALVKLAEEDPTFRTWTDEETGQTIIAGMGELHLEIIVDRLLREFKVEANVGAPQVAYKETIKKSVEQDTKYARQSGGKGQYGHVRITVEPNEPGKGYEFLNEITGGVIPKEYIPAVDAGIQGAMQAGVLAGYPVVDVKVHLTFGSYHEVDSSEMAFKIAGSMAFKEACRKADAILLEPVMKVSVIVPDEYLGNVIGDLTSRRGMIQGQESRPGATQVDALVPLASMFGYATDLRSSTQGRGQYSMEPHSYVEIPKSIAEKIIAERGRKDD